MQCIGITADKLFEQMRPQALKTIQSRLVLEAIVAAENLKAEESDFEEEIQNMAKTYGMEVDKLKEVMSEEEKESIMKDLAVKKAADFVVDNLA